MIQGSSEVVLGTCNSKTNYIRDWIPGLIVLTFNVPRMHLDTRVSYNCGVSDSFIGVKLFCSGLLPTITRDEKKNFSKKLSSVFYCPPGRHLNLDNIRCLHEFPAVEIMATHEVLKTMIALSC